MDARVDDGGRAFVENLENRLRITCPKCGKYFGGMSVSAGFGRFEANCKTSGCNHMVVCVISNRNGECSVENLHCEPKPASVPPRF